MVVASNIKLKLCVARLAITVAVLSFVVAPQAAVADAQSIALPGLRAFPESITSTADGTLFIGRIGDGGIVRANLEAVTLRCSYHPAHQKHGLY